MKIIRIIVMSIVPFALTVVAIIAQGNKAAISSKSVPVVDSNGNLRVPANYRTSYESLGSWAIAEDQGQGSKELHLVYSSPGTSEAYHKDGRFPDGSVLV